MEQLKAMKGSCLARPLETQASASTGFHKSLRKSIVDLDESNAAYDTISVDDPATKCLFMASMVRWSGRINSRLLDYLEKISRGECDEVLALDYAKLCNKDYWLSSSKKSEMIAYSDKPLKAFVEDWISDETSLDLYQSYETNICELADNLEKVKSTFEKPELYEKLMQQMKVLYTAPGIEYEYEQMKEEYVEPTMNDYLKMQIKACMDFLKSGMLNDVLAISNEEIEAVDEAKLYKMLDPDYKTPANLKKLWAKLKKFLVLKENVLLVPKRKLARQHVLKHYNVVNEDHYSALFRLDKLLKLMHRDMVKIKPDLAQYLNKADDTNTFGIMNSLTRLMQQDWFKDFRTDPKYDHAWIEKFVAALLTSEYRQELLTIWQDADKRLTLKGNIIGCLKMAGVIDGSDLGIATALLNGTVRENKTFASYMGLGKKMTYSKDSNYCSWICDHLKD